MAHILMHTHIAIQKSVYIILQSGMTVHSGNAEIHLLKAALLNPTLDTALRLILDVVESVARANPVVVHFAII